MSAARRASIGGRDAPCVVCLWKIFPHLFLSLSLVAYAALGAVIFEHIEGHKGNNSTSIPFDYRAFLGGMVSNVQELTDQNRTREVLIRRLEEEIKTGFKSIWLQRPERWDFFGSLFFCCTVFTTVGYGEIYPVTLPGKVVCILYSMVGIPLMLLVISDVGDVLAVLLSRAYRRLHKLGKSLCYRSWSPGRAARRQAACAVAEVGGEGRHRALEDGTFVFSRESVAMAAHRQPMDICQVLQSQSDVKDMLNKLQSNREIFEKILVREDFLRRPGDAPLLRSLSCPQLNRMPPPPEGHAMWDFSGIGTDMEGLDVPFVLILLAVVAYILMGGLVLPMWETEFQGFDPYYFCFITLTTIGFGDIVPQHPKYFMITSLFIITGMAIMSMAFKLGQTRIVALYRHCIRSMSRGHVVTMRDQEMLSHPQQQHLEGYL